MEEQNLDEILESALDEYEEDEHENKTQTTDTTESGKPAIQVKTQPDIPKTTVPSTSNTTKDTKDVSDEVTRLMESLVHNGDFDKTLSELASLQLDDPNLLQDLNMSDETIEQMVNDLQNKPEMAKVMQDMMGTLMSKDLMYEPLKEMKTRFPKWLETNKEKLSLQEYSRYVKQYGCIQKICDCYDNDPDNMPKLVGMMQEMQETGQPPMDILQEVSNELSDGTLPDLSQLQGDGNCLIM